MDDDKVFARCARRLIPFMVVLYMLAWLDRVNIGFAALTMNRDLNFSPSVFGFGAGVFFLGYFLFQVPANLLFARIGARRWIAGIAMAWGVLSASTAFVEGPIDQLDHGANQSLFGGKVAVDATRKWPEEGYRREWPEVCRFPAETEARAAALVQELGLRTEGEREAATNGSPVTNAPNRLRDVQCVPVHV